MVTHRGVTYTAHDLNGIGRNIASLWGGCLLSVEVDRQNKKVVFHCIEHGEDFCSELTYDELQEYK